MLRMPSEAVLAVENQRLRTLLDEQTNDLSHKDAYINEQASRIQQLEELIRTLRHRQFGASSERTD